jgi:hypothetical protein
MTPPDTDPSRCAWCDRAETPDATLLPIGVGLRHAWLHRDCWEPWRTDRRAQATAELAEVSSHEGETSSRADPHGASHGAGQSLSRSPRRRLSSSKNVTRTIKLASTNGFAIGWSTGAKPPPIAVGRTP